MIALCIPIGLYVLPKIFTHDELVLIDGDEAEIKQCLRRRAFKKLDFKVDGNNRDDADAGHIQKQVTVAVVDMAEEGGRVGKLEKKTTATADLIGRGDSTNDI